MSLNSGTRFSLLDWIGRESTGQRLEAAVFLSYSADLPTLYAALLTLAGFTLDASSLEDEEDALERELPRLSDLSDRVRILINPGGLSPWRLRIPSLSGTLDQIVREVSMRPGMRSAFHPKIALVKFVGQQGPPTTKLVVASRNLTMSHCLDVGACVRLRAGSSGESFGSAVSDFLGSAFSSIGGTSAMPGAIRQFLEEVAESELAPGDWPAEWRPEFISQRGGATEPSYLESARLSEQGTERVIISPFLNPAGLTALKGDGTTPISLLSTRKAYEKLLASAGGSQVLKGLKLYELSLDGLPGFDGLHAKMVLDRYPDSARIVMGSANATGPGLKGRNWEAGLSSIVPPEVYDRAKMDLFEKPKDSNHALAKEIALTDLEPLTETDEDEENEKREVEYALREMPVTGSISKCSEGYRLELQIELPETLESSRLSAAFFGKDVFEGLADGIGMANSIVLTAPVEEFSLFVEFKYRYATDKDVRIVRRVAAELSKELLKARKNALWRKVIKVEGGVGGLLQDFMGRPRMGDGWPGERRGKRHGAADPAQPFPENVSLEGLLNFFLQEPERAGDFEEFLRIDVEDGPDARLIANLRRIWETLREEVLKVAPRNDER